MLKSEVEGVIRRSMEETKAQFTEEQIQCLVIALMKICGRSIEEALSSYRSGSGPSGRSGFFSG